MLKRLTVSKPRLAILLSVVVLLQGCCCVLPIRWQSGGFNRNDESAAVQTRSEFTICAEEDGTTFAVTANGRYVVKPEGRFHWQWPEADMTIPQACVRLRAIRQSASLLTMVEP